MNAVTAHINRIGTANPPHGVHDAFLRFASASLADEKTRKLFGRMVERSGIEQRFSFLEPVTLLDGTVTDRDDFYGTGEWPGTARRMERYASDAPGLALEAIRALDPDIAAQGITHLIVASCTGFMAPGLDQVVIERAGLDPRTERTVVGFMGCYAAVNSLRLAHHIVRSTPQARVLVITLELCTLHFQRTVDLGKLLSMLLFGDGAAAALVTAEAQGIALRDFRAATISGTADAITWDIGDQGFDMHLGGEVPARITEALRRERDMTDGLLRGQMPAEFSLWAVHAGGRTILDAVEQGLCLPEGTLEPSRAVLREFGNMSSATLMFILARMLAQRGQGQAPQPGIAMAFGPGMAAEGFRFTLLG
ncbi:type III polyketide synthase [Novosphingobium pentaromativorans]|uniref:Chalcone synthase n=1 Tax=Novosphingobium pentaromativorans US6-1 TaxID=1088721 RepID=G6EGV6_9SPHN|nr:type III polyketide synthase [Novosphingobium pentaromativorans]AIT82052.1 stilbene synthase [Novosphingobium pentaromativorans US6-1]EHJ59245.1 chalcone synthase [Novosphingobium pentaromativorans US6-1]